MALHGKNFIGGELSSEGLGRVNAANPITGEVLQPAAVEATSAEIDRAARAAQAAFERYRSVPAPERATFLRAVARNILGLGDILVDRVVAETGLPEARVRGEQTRTANQLWLFADLVDEGSWVDARIDTALPERKPAARPSLRRMHVGLGPVAVFGASNFPLAFSVGGGDTASALAAGCPVVVKAHPYHPGTSELVAGAIQEAVDETGMPSGVFSMLHGASHSVGLELVAHPAIRAVAFTGSHAGGKALVGAASQREEPIPVFAEMGSSNPVFVLASALAERGDEIARKLADSITLGAGQFCTNPGLVVYVGSQEGDRFVAALGRALASASAGTMVHAGIKVGYEMSMVAAAAVGGVQLVARSMQSGPNPATEARPALLSTDAATWVASPALSREIFGPATLAVRCANDDELRQVARSLSGQLTATLFAADDDVRANADLVAILTAKAGRLILNGVPTGVEVSGAMHHGGPYPATSDQRFSSVGTAAIYRFTRPVCYQDFPESCLPDELRDTNPRNIWRLLDGQLTRDAI